jgi:serine/threonine protein kinase
LSYHFPRLILLVLYSNGRWKITGFALASISGNNDLPQQTENSRGTSGYRAPELVSDAYFSTKVDIWALGCIAYEILTRTSAFSDDFEIYSYSVGDFEIGFPSQLALGTSEYSIWQTVRSMLHPKGVKRPTARAVHCKFRSLLKRHTDGRRSPSPGLESETSEHSISSYDSELSLTEVRSNSSGDTVFDFSQLSKTLEDFLHFDCEQLMAKVRREHIPVGYQEAQWSTAGDYSISCVSQIGRGGSGRAYEVLSLIY